MTETKNKLEHIFKHLLNQYDVSTKQKEELWIELNELYASKNRHYHNLNHLSDIYIQLLSIQKQIENWNIILFTLFYHDAIYIATKKDNEEQSAQMAKRILAEIGVAPNNIGLCFDQILATKSHLMSPDNDTNLFTDADLSILGRDWSSYNNYCKQIRKEYSIYPNFLYKRGRRKVIQHYLSMDSIFKTEEFKTKFEEQAIYNLKKELASL